jgi:glycerophosphoryl diester phosphodiesterase
MLDLKGLDSHLASGLIETMATLAPGRPYAVSSQSWDLLEAFREQGHVFVIHSAGNERMLRDAGSRLRWHDHHAVGVDQRLLTPDRVAALRELAPTVFSWRVNTETRMHELLQWGVNGIISDSLEVLSALLRSRAAASDI